MELVLDVLRTAWSLILTASPYLLLGFLISGLIHAFIGKRLISSHLGQRGLKSVLKAVLIGTPLPVCSCSVIPLSATLRREGASKGASMAFLISSPITGVDSIAITYAFLGLPFTLLRLLATVVLGVLSGWVADLMDDSASSSERVSLLPEEMSKGSCPHCQSHESASGEHHYFPSHAHEHLEESHNHPSIWDKLRVAIGYAFDYLPREIGGWILLGIVLGGVLGVFADLSWLQAMGAKGKVIEYIATLMVAVPLYVCATGSVPIAAVLVSKGYSVGAALTFLIAGPATNTVTISFVSSEYGVRGLIVYLTIIVLGAISFGVFTDLALRDIVVAGIPSETMNTSSPLYLLSAVILLVLLVRGLLLSLVRRAH